MAELEDVKHELEILKAWKAGVLEGREKAPPVVVRTSKERKLRRFAGVSSELSDWIEDARASVDELSDTEASSFLWRHIEGVAREELRMYKEAERGSAEKIFDILREAFGERRSDLQIKRDLFDRRQGSKETLRAYSRALTELVHKLRGVSQVEKNKMLVGIVTLTIC